MTELETKLLNMIKELLAAMPSGPGKTDPALAERMQKLLTEITVAFNTQMQTLTASPDFIKTEELDFFVDNPLDFRITIWISLQRYIAFPNQELLNRIEETLKAFLDDSKIHELEADSHESFVLSNRIEISDPLILKTIAHSRNKDLINLYKKYFPSSVELKEEKEKNLTLFTMFDKSTLKKAENVITRKQRNVRGKLRQKEELQRIKKIYAEYARSARRSIEDLMKDANTPYVPQCDEKLANRIVAIANRIQLFSEIRHITLNPDAIASIMDDGLYGRATLQKFTMSFIASALQSSDIENGDANVICFGAFDIDTRHLKDQKYLEIILDVNKLAKDNPCIFFKQRDLQFDKDELRTVVLGEEKLSFTHTSRSDVVRYSLTSADEKSTADIPKFMLIAYDLAKIHQILILNFFRILDKIESADLRNKIYAALAKLDDKQLETFLTEMGRKFSDTCEFNFYGAHKIDFSCLNKIRHDNFELNLSSFIAALNRGDIKTLNEAREKIPALFTSQRFLNHLLDNIKHETVCGELREMLKAPDKKREMKF